MESIFPQAQHMVFTIMDAKQDVDALLQEDKQKLAPLVQKPPVRTQPEFRKKQPKRDYER